MGIKCEGGKETLGDSDVERFFSDTKKIPFVRDLNLDDCETLLSKTQKSLCDRICDHGNECAVDEFKRNTVRNEVMNYTRAVVIRVLGPNN